MGYDFEALDAKKREIDTLIRHAIPASVADPDHVAELLTKSFVAVTPPGEPEQALEMITTRSSGVDGGRSRKLGNIYLNWRKLMDLVPDVTIVAAGAVAAPRWLLPFVALYVWNKLWRCSEEELTETEAVVICALWKNRSQDYQIPEDAAWDRVNEARKSVDLPPLSRQEFDHAINRLMAMKCIEMDCGVIWLRERVSITY